MRKMITMTALALSVLMVASSAQAEGNSYTKKYTGACPVAVCVTYALGDPDVGDINGVRFEGVEGVPTTLSITAEGNLPVPFTAGQDLNGNNLAGEAGEPRVNGCAAPGENVSLSTSAVPWVDGQAVTVFLYAGSTNTACRGAATHGTVTLNTTL